MKFQTLKHSCGPAALSAALQAVGILRTEDELAHLAGTTTDGTGWDEMLTALLTVKKSEPILACVVFEEKVDVGLLRLLRALDDGHAVVLLVDDWSHYATAVGRLGDRVCIFDPGTSDSFSTMGLAHLTKWWRGPKGSRKPFCGIIV